MFINSINALPIQWDTECWLGGSVAERRSLTGELFHWSAPDLQAAAKQQPVFAHFYRRRNGAYIDAAVKLHCKLRRHNNPEKRSILSNR